MDNFKWHSRGYLPHIDRPGLIQGVTFRLWDSIPIHVAQTLASEPETTTDADKRERVEKYLNTGFGSCYLQQPQIAILVQNALLHFDEKRYRILAWVVMPNHVHVLVEPFEHHSLKSILHTWKSYTANEANQILGRNGRFWYREYFDRFIRDENHLIRAINYIHHNPVSAGLVESPEEYSYSSARFAQDRENNTQEGH